MAETIYIRASLLPSWNDCPRRGAAQQYRKLIEGAGYTLNERPPSIGGIVGTSVHTGAGVTIKQYIDSGTYAKRQDCIDVGIDTLRREVVNGTLWDSTTSKRGDAELQVVQMVTSYCVQVAPSLTPIRLEVQRESKFLEGVIFTGKDDVETACGIRDTKTGSREKSFHAQLGGYSLLRRAESEAVKSLTVDYLPRVSVAKTYPGAREILYDVKQCEELAYYTIQQIAESVKRFMATGNSFAFPCNPMSTMCSDKYCSAYGTNFCKISSHKRG